MRRFGIWMAVALTLCTGFGLGQLGHQLWQRQQGQSSYQLARELARVEEPAPAEPTPLPSPTAPESMTSLPEPTPAPVSSPEPTTPPPTPVPTEEAWERMDLAALQAVSPQVVGWIQIPDTALSYPVVQGTDNEYYLTHTWDGRSSGVGAIFMECRNRPTLEDENTVLYGHRMGDRSMFGLLKHYREESYRQAHPTIQLTTEEGIRCYRVFAAYEVPLTGQAYQLHFSDPAEKQAFLDDALARSCISTEYRPQPTDRILTLSTCTGKGHETRWVVQGAWSGEAGPPAEEVPLDGTEGAA